ncbi:MAG: UvrB/UvrC motif-containing protein [Akkermansia sp.]
MKKCEICSSPSTVFLTQIVDGKTTEISLCTKCAKERGLLDPEAFDLAEKLFSSTHGKSKKSEKLTPPDTSSIMDILHSSSSHLPLTQCPTCGFTLDDYRKIGRLGCSHCYDVFMEEILPSLSEIQSGTTHSGKEPEQAEQIAQEAQAQQTLGQLEADIKRAIAQENYEEAARIRDAITALRNDAKK